MLVEFGTYLPDLPPNENQGATIANNVLPLQQGYKSFPNIADFSTNTLDSKCLGAISGLDNSGNSYNFAGDASKLYLLSSNSWSNVSKVGGYTTSSEEKWRFTQYKNRIIGTNYSDNIQSYVLGTSSAFADLSASAPRARYLDVVRNFLVLGNIFDASDGDVPYRVAWSALGDETDFTPSATTQSDINDLEGYGGWVKQVVGGEYGIVFKENAIWRMTYVGSPAIFQFDELERDKGTPASNSVTKIGSLIPYLGQDGFYIFDGRQSISIGENQVDKTFYQDVNQDLFDEIIATVDPINKIIFWAYPSLNSVGNCDKIIAYNYSANAKKRWATADLDVEYIYRSLSEGYTMETLDNVNNNLDLIEPSLDSRYWTGGVVALSAFNTSHKLCTFSGSALAATIETGEFSVKEGMRGFLRELRAKVEGYETMTLQIGQRNSLSESVTWGSAISPNNAGNFPIRINSKYIRARVNLTGGFDFAQGIETIGAKAGGKR